MCLARFCLIFSAREVLPNDEEEEDDDDDVCTCGQVYSLGDEMYRKVKTTALMPLNKERLRKPYGNDAQLLREQNY